jgi:hypothetical protein
MVVIPTRNDVKLTYGLTKYEWVGRIGTLLGIVGVGLLIAWKGAQRYGAIVRRDDDDTPEGDDGDDDEGDEGDGGAPGHASDDAEWRETTVDAS